MTDTVFALYAMILAVIILGLGMVGYVMCDRKAQREHNEWLRQIDRDRPKNRTWEL